MKRLTATFVAAALVLGACGDKKSTEAKAIQITPLEMELPPEIEGLKVQREDIAQALEAVRPSYVDSAALFSLRRSDDLVQATLQASKFRNEERYETARFRRTIINQLGASTPRLTRMGESSVWRTSGSKLALAVWFDGKSMYLLSIRDDFDRPRSLIRTLLDNVGAE